MAFHSLEQICRLCREENKSFYQVVLEDDLKEREVSEEESHRRMNGIWQAMRQGGRGLRPFSQIFQRALRL